MKTALLKKDFFTVLSFFFISCSLLAQESRKINGTITTDKTPVPDVNIQIEGKAIGTKTDTKGNYTIKANVGDTVLYTHVGYKSIRIIVEDITSELNLNLVQKTTRLNETVVTARKKVNSVLEFEERMDIDLRTPFGTFNPKKSGFAIGHIAGDKLNLAAPTIEDALNGKLAGLRKSGSLLLIRDKPASFVVDGQIQESLTINLADIEDIYVVKIKRLVIINTKYSPATRERKRKAVTKQYQNQNYYNNDAVTVAEDEVLSSSTEDPSVRADLSKEVYGIITYLDKPLKDVNIKIKGTPRGTKTDADGSYKITTEIGDELEYSYVSFQTINIIVEDVTAEINIGMVDKANTLDEVIVTAKTKEGKVLERAKKANEAFETSRGRVDPNSAGYTVSYLDGSEIPSIYFNIKEALIGKIPGYSVDSRTGIAYLRGANSSHELDYPAAWEVDGVFSTEEPIGLDITQVKSVRALKSLASTNKYGTLGSGGVIVITTKYGSFNKSNRINSKIDERYTNNNYYTDDAVEITVEDLLSNSFTKTLEAFKNKGKAYRYYNENLKTSITEFDTHISIAQKFLSHYNDKPKAISILTDLAVKHQKNPEILKAIAFNLQTIKATKEAKDVLKTVAKLRPKYAQSYRDLANAYKENNDFKMSWRVYMNYLMNREVNKAGAIDQIVYNEMEYLYFNRQSQTQIKEQFVPNNESKLKFRNDVRFVVEWNTSEAEFDLEFVGPDKRAYVFEHTISSNQSLITEEKTNGYTSEEFFIDDIGLDEWLVNLTYYGNKKSAPTYFKLTTYYHWGKPEQKQEIKIYKLLNTEQKMQLKKVNKESLVTSK